MIDNIDYMEVSLTDLADGTEFTLDGKKYKRGNSGWYAPSKERLLKNQAFHDNKSPMKPCHGCYPFFGGKYQENITVWVPEDTKIHVHLE